MTALDPMVVVYRCGGCERPLAWIAESLLGTEQEVRFRQQCERFLGRCAACSRAVRP